MKTVNQAWQEHGVDDDMPPHDLFVAGWFAAMESGIKEKAEHCVDELALAIGTLESRERNIETILAESARLRNEVVRLEAEVNSLNLAEEGAKEAFGVVVQSKHDLEAKCKAQEKNIQSINSIAKKAILCKAELLSILVKIDKENTSYPSKEKASALINKATYEI